MIGFVDLGTVNQEIATVARAAKDPTSDLHSDSHMCAFMLRGIFTNLLFPLAHYPTQSLAADQLYAIVWELVGALEAIGMKVNVYVYNDCNCMHVGVTMYINCHNNGCSLIYNCLMYIYRWLASPVMGPVLTGSFSRCTWIQTTCNMVQYTGRRTSMHKTVDICTSCQMSHTS